MTGTVLTTRDLVIQEDSLGTYVARTWQEWHNARSRVIREWNELTRFLYATDTSFTTGTTVPWKNTTTIPKLCQIRDNLKANYMFNMFPKRKFVEFIACSEDSYTKDKIEAIENYSRYMLSQDSFKKEMAKLILDYIDYGNCFAMVDWEDSRQELKEQGRLQVGYIGPVVRRISPVDIVFNPTADNFQSSPKIIRTILGIGEVKEYLERLSTDENRDLYEKLWDYIKELRFSAKSSGSSSAMDMFPKDEHYQIEGYTSFRHYLESDYVELLTFYGDFYDYDTDTFRRNHIITVVDRHKVIDMKPNPSFFGYPTIFHVGWRERQDNLWAMGPLANLVGMQHRIDHIENLKADVFDLVTFPPLKIKGSQVSDFEWGPFTKIYLDIDEDVEILAPPFQVLTANQEIQQMMTWMEEMAGSPREAMGFRTPGEKTAFEVQRLENAASRIFQHKTSQFEEHFEEPILNAMLELARRRLPEALTIPVFDDELKATTFMSLTAEDITGAGKIRPIAARHFAEKAELVQTLTQFFGSPLGQDPNVNVHFSGEKIAEIMEYALGVEDYGLVKPYVRIPEMAQAQRLSQTAQQQLAKELNTPTGLNPEDVDQEVLAGLPAGAEAGVSGGGY